MKKSIVIVVLMAMFMAYLCSPVYAADGNDPRVVISRLDSAFQNNDKDAMIDCFIPELSTWYFELIPSERDKRDLNEISARYPLIGYPHTKKNYWPSQPPYFFDCDRYYIAGDHAELDVYVNFFDASNNCTYAVMGFLNVEKVDDKWKIASFSTESTLIHKYLGLMKKELKEHNVYIKKGDDSFFPVNQNHLLEPWDYGGKGMGMKPEDFNEEDIPVFVKGEHTLVTTSTSSAYRFSAVENSFYCLPGTLGERWGSDGPIGIGVGKLRVGIFETYGESLTFCELADQPVMTIDDLNAVCAEKGVWAEYKSRNVFSGDYFLLSNHREWLSVGGYSGTSFFTDILPITWRLYLFNEEEEIVCPVNKTKEGYFIVNTDNLPAGLYVLKIYDLDGYDDYLFRVVEPNNSISSSDNQAVHKVTATPAPSPESSTLTAVPTPTKAAQAGSSTTRVDLTKLGFQSDVNITVYLDANNVITYIAIDSASETPGFGTRCGEDYAFFSQFIGKQLPLTGTVDVLSGATVTSNSIIDALKAYDPSAQAATPTPAGSSTKRVALTNKGFQSDVNITVYLDANNVITYIAIDSASETPGFGTRCGEDYAFFSQFIGKRLPLTGAVDVLSGATVTSNSIIDALKACDPSAQAATPTLTPTKKPTPTPTKKPTPTPTKKPTPTPTKKPTNTPRSQYNWLIGKQGKVCVNEGIARSGAGTNYTEKGIVYYGEWYEILEVKHGNTAKDWCKIRMRDGGYAWISTGLLEIDGKDGGTIYGNWAD